MTITASRLVCSSKQDKVYFVLDRHGTPPAINSSEYKRLPRVRLTQDWGTYKTGDVLVVFVQYNNGLHGTSLYKGVLEGEWVEFVDHARTWPAELAERMLSLADAVNEAREENRSEALKACRFVRSRGTDIGTAGEHGPCRPYEAAQGIRWSGRLSELKKIVADIEANYPEVTHLYLRGGFDGSLDDQSFKEFISRGADYVPWAGDEWTVDVWVRGQGFKFTF